MTEVVSALNPEEEHTLSWSQLIASSTNLITQKHPLRLNVPCSTPVHPTLTVNGLQLLHAVHRVGQGHKGVLP